MTDPADFPNVFARNFNTGDASVLLGGYAEDALLDLGADQRAYGHDAIRAVLANFLAPGLPIVITPGRVSVTGNLAVVTFDWSIEGAALDGAPIQLGGGAIDVLRRDADGHWRQLIDLPFGVTTPR
jgi:ketosteroid isomerase-like protein